MQMGDKKCDVGLKILCEHCIGADHFVSISMGGTRAEL